MARFQCASWGPEPPRRKAPLLPALPRFPVGARCATAVELGDPATTGPEFTTLEPDRSRPDPQPLTTRPIINVPP